jgi:hypothetical protein
LSITLKIGPIEYQEKPTEQKFSWTLVSFQYTL